LSARRLLLAGADGNRRLRAEPRHVGGCWNAGVSRRARRPGGGVRCGGSRRAAARRNRRGRAARDRGGRPCLPVALAGRTRMSGKPEVGIGIVGYGLMGRAHAHGYTVAQRVRDLPCTPRLLIMSGRDEGAVARAAERYGVEEWTTDWRELVERPEVDIVDVCTPPGTHAEIVEVAAAAGKAVLCEKPLAADHASAEAAAKAAAGAGIPNAIGFNYRRLPALALMKQLVD